MSLEKSKATLQKVYLFFLVQLVAHPPVKEQVPRSSPGLRVLIFSVLRTLFLSWCL